MDVTSSGGFGRSATEALSRTFTNSPEKFNFPLRTAPSLQPRSSPLYSPDTTVFKTPEQGGRGHGRDEGLFPLHRGSTRGEPEQAFHDQMGQYALDQLAREWDGLFLGEGPDDVRSEADVYRGMRRDMRSLACALKQSFGLLVDNRRFSSGGAPTGSGQQLQPWIAELKAVTKEMASATRMANDNYNLQVELTLQKHASQHILAQLHEAQLARMALEEEINSLRAEAQRGAATESSLAHLRRLNEELQAEAMQASGELVDVRRRARELEGRLEVAQAAADQLAARVRELELLEDLGNHAHLRELCRSSDGGVSEAASSSGAAGAAVGTGLTAPAQLPPELRRLLGKVLRHRDAEAAKLQQENNAMAEELERLRQTIASSSAGESRRPGGSGGGAGDAASAAVVCPSAASAPGLLQLEGRCNSNDSWNSDDDFEWATRPAAGLGDSHPPLSRSQNGGVEHQEHQQPRAGPHSPRHRNHHRQAAQQQQQQEGQSRHLAEHVHQQQHAAAAAAAVTSELEAARETIARLTAELEKTQERLRTQQAEAAAAAVEAASKLRQQLAEAQAAEAAAGRAAVQAMAQTAEMQEALRLADADRDALAAQLGEARRAAAAEADAADAHAVAAAAAAHSDAVRLVSENDRMAADLAGARQVIASLESQLAASASAHAELQGRLSDAEQRERRERQARDGAAKELEAARQRLVRLQADMRDVRAEAQVARGEATAASRDVKAANSEKLKAQREMEEAVERLRGAETERDRLATALAEAEAVRRHLEARFAEEDVMAAAAAAVAEAEAEVEAQFSVSDKAEQALGQLQVPRQPDGAPAAAASDFLVLELQIARQELAAAQHKMVQQGWASGQEAVRLREQLESLQAELSTVRGQLAAAEERLARVDSEAAATEARHRTEAARLRNCVAEAQHRAGQLEEQLVVLRTAAAQDAAAAAAAAAADAAAKSESRLRELELKLTEAEAAQRQVAQRADTELAELRLRLAVAEVAAAAQASSASSSDAGVSRGGSPERILAKADAAAPAAAALPCEVGEGADGDDDGEMALVDGADLVALRARCRALRGELGLSRSRLAALVEVAEGAAQGRLAAALAEAQAAAAEGRLASDEEFWTRNGEVHSLHALVTMLRATCLYAGPDGAHATYGDTRADGAGSVVAASADQLASSRRRRLLHDVRLRCGQVAELLSEAEALARSAPPPITSPAAPGPHSHQQSALGAGLNGAARVWTGPGASAGSSEGQGVLQGRTTGHEPGRATAAAGGGNGSSLLERADVATAACTTRAGTAREAAAPGRIVGPDLGEADGLYDLDPSMAGLLPSLSYFGGGRVDAGRGAAMALAEPAAASQPRPVPLLPPPPVASSSFTSDTGSSLLADDDVASLSHMYVLPPMSSPPKFDFDAISSLG